MVTFDNLVHEIDARYCLGPKATPLAMWGQDLLALRIAATG
jgi:hypothetical protein